MSGWLGRFRARSPAVVEPPDELDPALATLGVAVDANRLTATAERVVVVVVASTAVLAFAVPDRLRIPAVALGAAGAAAVWWLLLDGPIALAAARRRRALATAPWLVCRAAMRLRVTPTPEAAAAFAARDEDRLLARRLAVHVERARGTPRAGFDGFRDEWGERFPPLDRAVAGLQTAVVVPAGDREATLDGALDAVLEGVRHRAADDAAALHGPVTALYAFGVLLPLALVAALPAAALAGLPVSVPLLVALYDLLLPALLLVAGAWLVGRRPVAFPAVAVPRDHPAVPDRRWPSLAAGVIAAAAAGALAHLATGPWAVPVAAGGAGGGVALTLGYRHERRVRERVASLEAGLPTALVRIGRAVADGAPVERAITRVADAVSGPASDFLAEADGRMSRLGVGVEAAFLGDDGALAGFPSPRAVGSARILAAAAADGRPAGPALVAAGDHLADLRRVERETRRATRRLTATMANTAAVFGPLVGGVTVALAGRLHGSELGSGVSVAALGPVVGVYVLALAAVLTALSTGLERGFDRAVVGYRVGLALVAATATYLVALRAARLLA